MPFSGSPHWAGGPFSGFPELQVLLAHEPWLTQSGLDLRAQCVWERIGHDLHGRFFIIRRGQQRATLGVLMRVAREIGDFQPVYMRLYGTLTDAQRDGSTLEKEIQVSLPRIRRLAAGVDAAGQAWSVRIVQRATQFELQMSTSGLIPETADYLTLEETRLRARRQIHDRALHPQYDSGDVDWALGTAP